jgi:molecular chaperone GrpE
MINELQEKIVMMSTEVEKVKKAAADITNRNKQMEIDKKFAASDLVKKLLVPMSYFEGALKMKTEDAAFNNFLKGFEMIYNLILDTLKSDGLKEIETNVNDLFNPHLHEVTEVVEVDEGTSEMILEVLQKGFTYKDRVIKPVQVKVTQLKKTNNNEVGKDNEVGNDNEVGKDNEVVEELSQEDNNKNKDIVN